MCMSDFYVSHHHVAALFYILTFWWSVIIWFLFWKQVLEQRPGQDFPAFNKTHLEEQNQVSYLETRTIEMLKKLFFELLVQNWVEIEYKKK